MFYVFEVLSCVSAELCLFTVWLGCRAIVCFDLRNQPHFIWLENQLTNISGQLVFQYLSRHILINISRHIHNGGSRMGRKRDIWTDFGRKVDSLIIISFCDIFSDIFSDMTVFSIYSFANIGTLNQLCN